MNNRDFKGIIHHLTQRTPLLKQYLVRAYLLIKDYNGREHMRHLGSLNPEKTIYVIRKNAGNKGEGLLSIVNYVMCRIDYADRNGLVPFVDLQSGGGASDEMFDRYFCQKGALPREDVFHSQNVLFSGWDSKRVLPGWGNYMNCDFNVEKKALWDRYIDFKPIVKQRLANAVVSIHPETCLGLYLRGTDYVRMRPSGHPIQPSLAEVQPEIDRILREERLERIFLVTEDRLIHDAVTAIYGDRVVTVDGDLYWESYEKGRLRDTIENKGDLADANLIYLIKEIILSQCAAFVGGRTNGSSFACAMNGGRYRQKWIYDHGYYD